jgi:hypothetical protein
MSGSDNQIEVPVAWEVIGAVNEPYFDTHKRNQRLQPLRERYSTKAEADARKLELQREGWVATATPIYLDLKAREAQNRRRQSSRFGNFCEDWRLKP